MKQQYTGPYTFDVAARTITLAGIEIPQERLALIVNSTVGFIYHNLEHEPTAQVTISGGNTIIVFPQYKDCETHRDSDALSIFYDDGVDLGQLIKDESDETQALLQAEFDETQTALSDFRAEVKAESDETQALLQAEFDETQAAIVSTTGGILSAVGYDAIDSFNGDYAIYQGGLDKGGVINIVGGVITVVTPGSGYSAGFANSVGGTRFVVEIDPSAFRMKVKAEFDQTQTLLQTEFDETQTAIADFRTEVKAESDETQSLLNAESNETQTAISDFRAEVKAESDATQTLLQTEFDETQTAVVDFRTEVKAESDATQALLNLKLAGLINGFLGIEHLVKYSAENGVEIDFTPGGYGPSQIVFSKGNTVLKTIWLIYDGRGDLVLITPEWSPLLLSPSLWLESRVVVSDGAVSQWSDSSGNGLNLSQPNVSQRPLYNTTINGLPAVNFSGGSMNLEGVNFTKGPGVYIIFAGQHNAAASAEGAVSHYFDSVTSTQRVSVRYFPGGTIQAITRGLDEGDGDDVESIRVYNYNFQARPFILSFASGVSAFIKVDGGAASSFGALGGESFTGLNLGNWLNDSLVMNGAIGEFIVLDQAPSLTEQSQLEGYLAHKWGAAGYLPANHPYKTSPP